MLSLPDIWRSPKPSAKSGSSISLYITTAKKQTGIREEFARSPSTKETSQMILDENTLFINANSVLAYFSSSLILNE